MIAVKTKNPKVQTFTQNTWRTLPPDCNQAFAHEEDCVFLVRVWERCSLPHNCEKIINPPPPIVSFGGLLEDLLVLPFPITFVLLYSFYTLLWWSSFEALFLNPLLLTYFPKSPGGWDGCRKCCLPMKCWWCCRAAAPTAAPKSQGNPAMGSISSSWGAVLSPPVMDPSFPSPPFLFLLQRGSKPRESGSLPNVLWVRFIDLNASRHFGII